MPIPPRWPRWPLIALGLSAGACQINVPNGKTISGSPSSQSFAFTGYSTVSGGQVKIDVLESLNTNARSSGAVWHNLKTTNAGTSPHTSGTQDYFGYLTTVAGISPTHWPNGGVARLRILYDTGSGTADQLGFTFDDLGCLASTSGTYDVKALACASHDTGYIHLVDTDPIAPNSRPFISLRGTSAPAAYYTTIDPTGAKDTLTKWKTANHMNVGPGPFVNARYYNEQDLRFGRDMNCRRHLFTGKVACYVANYGDPSATPGPAAGDDPTPSLAATLARDPAGLVATVAMEFRPGASTDSVTFYAFNAAGDRVEQAILDSQGPKSMPGLCLACHGGVYDSGTNSVTGAKFLPFDLDNFKYSTTAPYTKADQQDEFRALNSIVLATRPSDAIEELIEGWYDDGTGVADLSSAGPDQDSGFVPAGWAGQKVLYTEVIKPYCRTCHMSFYDSAAGVGLTHLDLNDFNDLKFGRSDYGAIQGAVCGYHDMPHAEVTKEKFWQSPARAHLIGVLQLSTACN